MATAVSRINQSFESASKTLAPELRACHVIAAFTAGTLGKTFDAREFQVNLSRCEELGEYVMGLELSPDASHQNEVNLNELAIVLNDNIGAIRDDVVAGSHELFRMDIHPVERGFALLTPDLNDFTVLYERVSSLQELNWGDAKFCAELGHEYSLADLRQVVALVPEAEDEETLAPMDRPLDMGLPRARLQ